ncbi:hypothetical protein ABZP36_011517 [Zizania latifolia]
MDGSNALILPCKRKNKSQGKAKNGKKNRQDPKISKSKLKKLQKLEEGKQKNLLQARSIEIFRHHKISVGGYSLLPACLRHYWSSIIDAISAETLKEKLRQAAQFSRADLVVPEDLLLFKKDEEVFPHKFVDPTDAKECNRNLTGRKSKNVIENGVMKPVECERMVDVGMSNHPERKTEGIFDLSDTLANSTIKPSVSSCSCEEIDLQDEELRWEEATVQEYLHPPIVVPVSRPYEVEKARRDLPIIMMEQEIMEAIYENSVIILCGETCCGKTTQVPQNLNAEHLDKLRLGLINPEDVINQLKVVLMSATLQLKDFISNRKLFDVIPPALKVPVRQFPVTVHFSKRTHDDYLGHAYKKVMSIHMSSILTRKPEKVEEDESSSSPEVDEKEIYEAYDDMFSSYEEDEINAGPNVDSSDIETEGEMDTDSEDDVSDTYETQEEDMPVLEFLKGAEGSSVQKASFKAISTIKRTNLEGSIPSVPCFSKCTKPMSVSHGKLRVLPLYAMLPALQQLQNYNHATGMVSYEIQWISKASVSQRARRAGRTGPGHCCRLYSAAAYGKDELFPEFSEPEITKIPVDGVVPMLKFMGIDESKFPFPTPPKS